jgi:hypothetical protein
MRAMIAVFTVVLLLIAVAGLGAGVLIVATGASAAAATPGRSSGGGILSLGAAIIPFALGMVALGFATVILAVDQSRAEQVAALDQLIRGHQERDRRAPARDPALAARRARLAAATSAGESSGPAPNAADDR